MDKVYSLLGLAARSRNVVSGEFATEKAVKTGKAVLVIVSGDASDNTVKKFSNMCGFYEVPMFQYGRKEELGHAMGKGERSSAAITDEGFAKTLKKHLEVSEE
ncbi:MAG: ribosomal L7Ae/L30e/S12e/Gadd45 family protein [Lachnospiraceae bacterium]|nr:ribosomal L7Ae/L30e/S12e/Gadd45 family protein [Lachnospiraceae bacterium]